MFKSKPKVLFIGTNSADYLQDALYQGLVSLLGLENVKELPFNRFYHFPLRAYPRNLGRHEQCPVLKWKHYFPAFKADFVLVAAAKPQAFLQYLSLLPELPARIPVVFADGGDRDQIGGDLEREGFPELYQKTVNQRPFDLILKREYLLTAKHPANVIPMPFAIAPARLKKALQGPAEPKYDVTFWAVESDPIRSRALELIEDQFDCRSNGTTRRQTFKKYKRKGDFYLQELRRARITLNFRGVGWDTLRYWEVPALSRFLISQRPQIQIPDNFRPGQEIIYCQDDLSDLVELCQHYLENQGAREKIAQAAGEWSLRFHTPEARARRLLTALGYEI